MRLLIVIAAAIAMVVFVHPDPAAGLTGAARGGTLGCRGLERLWVKAGGPRWAARTAASVAMAESSGRQYATGHNTNGTVDRGYFQVNSVHGALSTYGALANAKAAVTISHHGTDWRPWTTWQTGAYRGRC